MIRAVALALLLVWPCVALAGPIPAGDGYQVLKVGSYNLEVFTYKPAGYRNGPLLMVFHGSDRNADTYRDNAKGLADRFGFVVAAPLFDKSRFPDMLYQRGGIANQKALQPQEKWVGTTAIALVDQLRRDEGRPDMDYYLIGHSAGGQFLARLTPFVPQSAKRIVIANPSAWVFPTARMEFPYGLGGATAKLVNDDFLRRYLAAPITVYVGMNDTGSDGRDDNDGAVEQGVTRHERGLNFFKAGQALAKEKGWALNWRLVEAPKVGHSSKRMFDAPQARAAFFD